MKGWRKGAESNLINKTQADQEIFKMYAKKEQTSR